MTLEALQDYLRGECQVGHIRKLIADRLDQLASSPTVSSVETAA